MDEFYARFGDQVRSVRKAKQLSQEELADRIQLGRTSIVNIEQGHQRLHLHTFIELADALDVSPQDLLPVEAPEVPEIADQVSWLPAPARDWVMRTVTPEPAKAGGKRRRGSPS